MARRGKAASRRSRQRRAQRAQAQPRPQGQQPQQQPAAGSTPGAEELTPVEAVAEPSTSAVPVDAFEAADAELRASTPPPGTRAGSQGKQQRKSSVRARTSDFNLGTGSSRLTEAAAAEYHYVGRDLRNIGILLAIMAVLLAAATIIVNLLGI
jgi:hypothetical protein